jgi:hypothetical protein
VLGIQRTAAGSRSETRPSLRRGFTEGEEWRGEYAMDAYLACETCLFSRHRKKEEARRIIAASAP